MSSVVAKKATAEIVTIQFTKKYENISTIVSAVWGTKTSLRMLMRPIPMEDPTASRFSFALPRAL